MQTLNRSFWKGIILILTFGPVYVSAESHCNWVETTGQVLVENMTPEEARQIAIRQARAAAIEQVSGIEIQAHTLVRNFLLAGQFIRSLTEGYILDEKIVKWEQDIFQDKPDKPPLTLYRVHLKCCVTPQTEKRDPYFALKAELNKNVFVSGEEAALKISCSRECYVSILNFLADDSFKILLPNPYQKNTFLKSGEELIFPSQGLALVMEPEPGYRRSAEAFLVVATKDSFDLQAIIGKKDKITISQLSNAFLTLPSNERTERILVYEVRQK